MTADTAGGAAARSSLLDSLQNDPADTCVLVAPHHPAGEVLALAATGALLTRAGLAAQVTTWSSAQTAGAAGALLVVGPGTLVTDEDLSHLAAAATVARRVVVLPQRLRPAPMAGLLKMLDGRVALHCREPDAHRDLLAAGSAAAVLLDDDMALHLGDEAPGREDAALDGIIAATVDLDSAEERLFVMMGARFYFQDGPGRTKRLYPASSRDISAAFATEDPARWRDQAAAMMRYVGRAAEVHTDRLDVAVAASLQGRRTSLYDDPAQRLGAVYRHSLHGRFPRLQFLP